jgi:hypothetical protein
MAQAVTRVATDTAALAVGLGEPTGAALLRTSLRRLRAGAATVVVVGEKKRGKSSLINALLCRADLLPVDVDVATNVHLSVGYAAEPGARAVLSGGGSDEPTKPADPVVREIELASVAEYAALDPDTRLPRRTDVLHVDVRVPDPMLRRGLCLVDTPGVGGLTAGHATLAIAAAADADALLFVVNGASELTESEFGFLRRLAERTGEVLFVLAQIDKYADWKDVLARDQQLVRTHAPRLADAPWFPVSSHEQLDADRFARRGRVERAAQLAQRSGFRPLRATLTDTVAERADRLRLRNTLHVTGQVLDRLVDAQRRRLRSLDRDPAMLAEAATRREHLARLREETAWWRAHLGDRFQLIENAARLELNRQIADLAAAAEERMAAGGRELLEQLPGDLAAAVGAVWMTMQTLVESRVAAVAGELGARFSTEGIPELALGLTLPDRLATLPGVQRGMTEPAGAGAVFDRVLPSLSLGSMTLTLGAAAGLPLIAPLIAGGAVVWLVSERRQWRAEELRTRTDARRYVAVVTSRLSTELPPLITEALRTTVGVLRTHVTDQLAAATTDVEREIAEHNRALRAADDRLAGQRAAVTRARETLEGLRRQSTALRAHLDGPDRPRPQE